MLISRSADTPHSSHPTASPSCPKTPTQPSSHLCLEKRTHCSDTKNAPQDTHSPLVTSYSFTVLSQDPDATFVPSGENYTLLTPRECSCNVPTNSRRDFSKLPAFISFLKSKSKLLPLATRSATSPVSSSLAQTKYSLAMTVALFLILKIKKENRNQIGDMTYKSYIINIIQVLLLF